MVLAVKEESEAAGCSAGGGGTVTWACLECEQALEKVITKQAVAKAKLIRVSPGSADLVDSDRSIGRGCAAMVFANVRRAPCSRPVR